jgi:Bcr/CflA subfamily drug resistance transporter
MKKNITFIITVLIACIGAVSSDIYTPSVPSIAHLFNVPLSTVQLSMAIFMGGYAFSQLFYGPFSEVVGRRKTLFLGLIILMLGSLICILAPNMEWLLFGRLIQGLGAGGGSLFRAIFRDSFEGAELAKYGSYATMMVTFVVPAAPALGGLLQQHFNFRASFIFILTYAIVATVMAAFWLQETNQHRHKERSKLSFIGGAFKELLSSRVFVAYSTCGLITFGAFFSWMTAAPVLLIHNLGVSPSRFGCLILLGGVIAMLLAGWINARVVKRVGAARMLEIAWGIMLLSGISLLIITFYFKATVIGILIPAYLFYFGATFVWPNIYSLAFTPFGHIAGYAGAVYGCLQTAGAAVIGSVVSYLPHGTAQSLAWVFISCSILAFCLFKLVYRPENAQ